MRHPPIELVRQLLPLHEKPAIRQPKSEQHRARQRQVIHPRDARTIPGYIVSPNKGKSAALIAAAAISDFRHHREGVALVLLPKGHSVSPATAGVLCTPDLCGRPLDAGQALLRVGKRWRKTTGSGEPSHSRRPRRPPADTVCTQRRRKLRTGAGRGGRRRHRLLGPPRYRENISV